MEWRKRLTGPNPGNRANRVGVALTPKMGRFDWGTQVPPFCSVRSQNPCPSTFAKDTEGVSLRELCTKLGSVMAVCQSSSVENVLANTLGVWIDESFTSRTGMVVG